MTATYRVEGMTCEGCKKAVTNAIRTAIPGAGVEVDLARGLVTISGAADEVRIRTAVETAGFTFSGEASPL